MKDKLNRRLQRFVRKKGYFFEPIVQKELKELIDRGTSFMTTDDIKNRDKVYQVEANLETILKVMLELSNDQNYYEGGKSLVVNAKSKLCPIWPFC